LYTPGETTPDIPPRTIAGDTRYNEDRRLETPRYLKKEKKKKKKKD
jgi:hypothetical protein